MTMKILMTLIACIPFILKSQETPRVQLGIDGGMGITLAGENRRKGIAYELGQSTIIKKKGKANRRIEVFLKFTDYNYTSDSRDSYFGADSTYALNRYKAQVFNAGLKWHIPIVHHERYRLIIAPGFAIGSLLTYRYKRSWYLHATNEFVHEMNSTVYPTVRIMLGPHVSINQEFRLTPMMYAHLNLNFMAQSNLAGFEGYSVGWGGVTVSSGIYWYLRPKGKSSERGL
jgi:hypothetical protein